MDKRLIRHAEVVVHATVQTRITMRARVIADPVCTRDFQTAFARQSGESLRPNDTILAMVAHELPGPLAPLRLAAAKKGQSQRATCPAQVIQINAECATGTARSISNWAAGCC
ncbi:hypothetical protein PQQ52_21505 [Paraburkholderia sediminicola]|uniref:hypothetical protein n=1 Tax=Paraburkholderia sediminicola TaxID=458836 RepID=UPI0038BBF127